MGGHASMIVSKQPENYEKKKKNTCLKVFFKNSYSVSEVYKLPESNYRSQFT